MALGRQHLTSAKFRRDPVRFSGTQLRTRRFINGIEATRP